MKNIFLIIITISILLAACKKDNVPVTLQNNTTTGQGRSGGGLTYYFKGSIVDSTEIDWDSETLSIVCGFNSSLTDVLIFEDDADLIAWADTTQGGEYFIKTLEDVSRALEMAVKMGVNYENDTSGIVFEKYQNYLAGFVHSSSRGVTKLYWDANCTGSEKMIWVPTSNVGSTWNNQTSSIQFATIGGFLANFTGWGGQKRWYFTVTYGQIYSLGNFNDKTTSVWIN